LLITADVTNLSESQRENLPTSWRTLAAATGDLNLNGEFEELDTFEPSNNADVRIVAMSVDFLVTENGSFALNASQQANLASILTNFSQLGFYVGIMGEIRNNSMADGSHITFTTTSVTTPPPTPQPVPEPSSMLLLGTGVMALVGRRFRRA
jgi:hypothetical protein